MMNLQPDCEPALIAVVDDEQDITTFLGMALEDHGYRVVTINDAGDSLVSLRDQVPDLICLDLLMPQRTGASVFQEIRNDVHLSAVPVLILSGLNARDDLHKMLDVKDGSEQLVEYLEKPIARDIFLETIAGILARNKTEGGRQ